MSAEPVCDELLHAFSVYADRSAIVDEPAGSATTFRELHVRVAAARRQLCGLGIRPGCVVPIVGEKSAATIALALAALLEGATFAWLNPRLRPSQLQRMMQAVGAVGLFVDETGAGAFRHATPEELAVCRPIVVGGGASPTTPHTWDARCPGAACVLFTSGSTGEPKGVIIAGADLLRRARTEIECFELTSQDRLLCVLPLSFDVGLNQLFSALLSGAALHVSTAWLRHDLAAIVHRAQITGISAVPSIWASAMNRLPAGTNVFGATPSLRYVTVSGGSLPVAAFEQLSARLDSHVAIHKTYGQSETFRSAIFLHANAAEHRDRLRSVGRAVPGTRILIANDRETCAAAGERGEIVHVGDGVMLGYLGDEELTRQKLGRHAITGDAPVIYTGDYGHLDADGYLHLAGRADSMIKTFGFRVYPREVEEVIAQFPGVAEAIVFGVDDPHMEQKLIAVVLGDPALDVARLRAFCGDRLPAYMVPRQICRWSDVPRTSSGKPALAEIKRRFLDGTGAV